METTDLASLSTTSASRTPVTDLYPDNGYFLVSFMNVVTVICFGITFVLGTVGNGLVIWIAGVKMTRTVNTIWFLNLGLANFTLDIVLPFLMTELIMDEKWLFGRIMCKITYTVILLNMSVSASLLMLISIDRCTSVLYPVWSKNHRTPRLAMTICLITWLSCLILSSPYLKYYDIIEVGDTYSYCGAFYALEYEDYIKKSRTMLIIRFVSMFAIPFSVILASYSLIIVQLRKSRSLSGSSRPFKVIISIVLCFFISWFPFHFFPMLAIIDIDISWKMYIIIHFLSQCLAYFNSCVNPMLYVFIGRDFKKHLIKSIPFLLESTFRDRNDLNPGQQYNDTVSRTEMETYRER